MALLFPLSEMLIPELMQFKQEVQRSFNMGNRNRQYSGLQAETANDLTELMQDIQNEIDSRQQTNNNT